jgi:predicted nucleic acid-binding protein
VILADTSSWVEYLRATGSPANIALRGLLDDKLAITEPVAMEVLAGARDDHHLGRLRGILGRAELIPCTGADYLDAAAIYRRCRQQGDRVRSLVDCLIAAVAIRARLPILHSDNKYDVIARHTSLEVHPTR